MEKRNSKCIRYEPIESVRRPEPRIELIQTMLESLLAVIDFEYNGKVVKVNGFRLKNLAQWCTGSGDLFRNLGCFSTACNGNCEFCYRKGNPAPGILACGLQHPFLTREEVETRIRLHQATGRYLFTPTLDPGEAFCNPHLFEILERVRPLEPQEVFTLITTGWALTEEFVQRLSALRPIFLEISLNTADPMLRQQSMGNGGCTTVITGVPLLREHGIPFVGSIVGWPTIPLEDIEKTIRYLDLYEAQIIYLRLPGYTRFFSAEPVFDYKTVWTALTLLVARLRRKIETPLLFSPVGWEQDLLLPDVDGVIRNSPAYYAGLRYGDRIISIEERSTPTRAEAWKMLQKCASNGDQCALQIQRNENSFTLQLRENADPEVDAYPYRPQGYPSATAPFGVCLVNGLEMRAIKQAKWFIQRHKATRVLWLTSELLRNVLERLLHQSGENFAGIDLYIEMPAQRFWGGNIVLGDLLTVDDFISHIHEHCYTQGVKPDLVLIPSTPFNPWGRDVLGEPFLKIQRITDVPLELIEHPRY